MKCVAYIRVSKDTEDQKTSLTTQRLLFEQYAAQHNYKIVDFYIDIQSGTTNKRPAFQKLLNDIPLQKFDLILAKELSRLARNGGLAYTLKDLALTHNVGLITLDQAINTPEDSYEMFGLYSWIYEKEAQTVSNRVKASKISYMKHGYFIGSIAPYGYYLKDKKLFIRDDNSPFVVKRIFSNYLDGLGFDKIAKNLSLEGIPTPSEIANKSNASSYWHGSTIRKILENRHYIGDLVQGKETTQCVTIKKRKSVDKENQIIIPNTHQPIISSDIYFTVQELINTRKQRRPAPQSRLFSNLVFCADCGKGMHYRLNRKGYICGTHSKFGNAFCSSHLIKETALIEAILSDLNILLKDNDFEFTITQLNTLLKVQIGQYIKQLKLLKQQLTIAQKENSLAFTQLATGTISRIEYENFINMPERCIDSLKQQININTFLINELKLPHTIETLHTLISTKYISELTPSIINTFIEKIEIGKRDSIKIYYRFNN